MRTESIFTFILYGRLHLLFFYIITVDVQIFKLLLINRTWAFVRLVKARSPSLAKSLDSAVFEVSDFIIHLKSIGSAPLHLLFFYIITVDVQILKLLFINRTWTFVHR